MGRAPCCEKGQVKKGAWSPEEDKILVDFIAKNGHGTWRSLPKLAGLQRCGKSCRLRWTNYLRPEIRRGPFTFQEETTIIKLHAILGNKWAAIASELPGRTDNEVKNFWNSHLKKRFVSMGPSLLQYPPITSKSIVIKTESPSTRHMAQWESARVEAEARLSMNSSLAPSSKPNSDYFLKLWNSEVGQSFRKIDDQFGKENESPPSQTCSSTGRVPIGASGTSTSTWYHVKDEVMMGGCSGTSDSYEIEDSSDSALKLLLDFPGGNDMGFLQGHFDDFSIFLQQ